VADLTVTQVVPMVTKVSAASVNTPNNEQSFAFSDHVNGRGWQHSAPAILVDSQTDNSVLDTSASDLYTVILRITTALKKAVNPDAASWASAVNLLATTENIHDNYTLLLNHAHTDATNGGKLVQANTHQTPDTDLSATSLHHTLGVGVFQAAAGNHLHSIYALGSDKNATNGYPGLTNGLIADNQISTNLARVSYVDSGNAGLQTQVNNRSIIGHVHGANSEAQIATSGVADSAVTTIKIADNAITTLKILDASVTGAKVVNATLDASTKLVDKTVTTIKIADAAITSTQLGAAAVTSTKLANASILNTHFGAGSVDNNALGAGAVDSRVLANNSVAAAHIVDGSITTAEIANGAVTDVKIQAGGLAGTSLADNSIDGNIKIRDYSIGQSKIMMGAITPTSPPSLAVNIAPIRKWSVTSSPVEYKGGIFDLTSFIPGPGSKRYVLLQANGVGAIIPLGGDITSGTPQFPNKQPNVTGLGYVYLEYGMTFISASNVFPWVGPDDGNSGGGGGSPIGHIHGLAYNESLVSSIGLSEGYCEPTSTPSLSINIRAMHYRNINGQIKIWNGGIVGPFAVPNSGQRIDAIYLNTSTGLPTTVVGTPDPNNPAPPAFTGDQRSLCYLHYRSTMTYIGLQDDGVNGWIEDARQWVGGGGGPGQINSVSTGGTGVATFNAGVVISPAPGGTTPLTTIAGPTSSIVGITDTQTISNKTFTQANAAAIGTIFKQIASPTVDLLQYQDSAGVAFGNVSRYNTFGMGAIADANRRLLVGGTLAGSGVVQIQIVGQLNASAASQSMYGLAVTPVFASVVAGNTGEVAIGVYSVIGRAAGDSSGTFGTAAAYYGSAPTFATNNYLILGSGDIGTTGVSAFPASPATNQTCYRADFRSWFMFDGARWNQMAPGIFTGAFPANPVQFMSVTRTENMCTYYWSGSAWVANGKEYTFWAGLGAQSFDVTLRDIVGSSVTFTTYGNSTVRVDASLGSGSNTGQLNYYVNVDGSAAALSYNTIAGSQSVQALAKVALTAGSHTVKLQAQMSSGTASFLAGYYSVVSGRE
jgi:hypothetical protein